MRIIYENMPNYVFGKLIFIICKLNILFLISFFYFKQGILQINLFNYWKKTLYIKKNYDNRSESKYIIKTCKWNNIIIIKM